MLTSYRYISSFANLVIKPLVSEEKDRLLAQASLVEVSHFLPRNIDTATNLDILPIAFNACVVNRGNKNKDIIDTNTAIAIYKHFIHKPINVEHNRHKVIGTVLTAGFSKFGTDEPLSPEEVQDLKGPFNITLGGIIWRVTCPELADHIEESSDPSSDQFLSVSASWELGFSDYKVVLLPGGERNLEDAVKILTEAKDIDPIRDSLTSKGGDGKIEDLFAFRMPSADVLPLGIGLTEKPAAEVKGVATQQNRQEDKNIDTTSIAKPDTTPSVGINTKRAFEDKYPKSNDKEILGDVKNQNNISQSPKTNVNPERNQDMKITSIQELTDETLKQCTASVVSDFISTELKKGSDEWEKQKNALSNQLAEAKANNEKLTSEQAQLQEQIKQMQASLDTLNAERAEREKVEKFNARMSQVNEAFDLDDEVRAALVEDIKAIASDEDFAKWQARAKILLKGFAKKAASAKDGDKDDKGKMGHNGDCKASDDKAAADAALAAASKNGDPDKGGLPNGTSAASQTLVEKYKAAFAKENFEIRV